MSEPLEGSASADPRSDTPGTLEGPDSSAEPFRPGCTQAQLRRFIKSRPYVPMHELRRRFAINGADDDVSSIEADGHRVFVGLPAREARMVGELVRQGEIGCELLLDPCSPIVIGVFPMRPIPRS